MTDDEVEVAVNATALAVPSKPVPHDVLLAALLDQHGHYVSDKVVDLMGVAGVAPHSGVALVTRGADLSIVPPGVAARKYGNFNVLFCRELWKRDRVPPWVGITDAKDPHILVACAAACARWGDNGRYDAGGRGGAIFYPWGYIHQLERWDDQPAGDPVVFHAESFAEGRSHGIVALTAGRLGDAVLAIVQARWLFPVEGT